MRLLLAVALILLFLWLHKAQTPDDNLHGSPCEAASMSEAAVSVLLSPLSLYSWLASTVARLILSVPALVLHSFGHSLLLLLAWPWCIASVCVSLLMVWFQVAVYLLHLALVVGVVAILTATRPVVARADIAEEEVPHQPKKLEKRNTKSGVKVFG